MTNASTTGPAVTLAEEIKSLKRELGFRRRVYANKVAAGTMTQTEADREIACTEATLARLESLQAAQQEAAAPSLFSPSPSGTPLPNNVLLTLSDDELTITLTIQHEDPAVAREGFEQWVDLVHLMEQTFPSDVQIVGKEGEEGDRA